MQVSFIIALKLHSESLKISLGARDAGESCKVKNEKR